MIRALALLTLFALAACATPSANAPVERLAPDAIALPPMKQFGPPHSDRPARSNRSIETDILDLTFRLESGRELPIFSRFEGPITVRVVGRAPPYLHADLDRLLVRLRREAGIDISKVGPKDPASITIEVLSRSDLQRAVPQAACFVVPRMTSWGEFRRNRRSAQLDWTTLELREKMAIFLPGDVSPQEIRDCLHEELAQAIGPLNDLYRLSDSVFNDDNFHTVLTGFDMLVLRTLYATELRSGMTRAEVAVRLPGILDRLNPAGRNAPDGVGTATPRTWINAIETALGPRTPPSRRRLAARQAVEIAQAQGWTDARAGFSLYALGRLSIVAEPELAMAAFLQSGSVYRQSTSTDLHAAHVAMQLAAFALSAGQADIAIDIVDRNLRPVARAENAALLSTLMMVKAEALELKGDKATARKVREDALGWARYGFGSDAEVRARYSEIAALAPDRIQGS
ncbi:DUF2927 domain-containing protein [Ovoidimarina sediminis]|uniref:DUF2927 domain-containing protein n=1 Tax=Ovoidimarina sediminis TaxID=3079856 RepID=UPI00290DF719|nr:DUF2927 domain-containing protein [Rhodophyticola sp. MJ-SS7]MDU8944885.1 DUF2927 domain-containing protein [Rhodophyticola sp. MJ-SS7]